MTCLGVHSTKSSSRSQNAHPRSTPASDFLGLFILSCPASVGSWLTGLLHASLSLSRRATSLLWQSSQQSRDTARRPRRLLLMKPLPSSEHTRCFVFEIPVPRADGRYLCYWQSLERVSSSVHRRHSNFKASRDIGSGTHKPR